MYKWWQDPRLDDEGTYDYLLEEIPENCMKWDLSKTKWKCDECGKHSHLLHESHYYFHTLDGWDSIDCTQCWRCYLKNRIFNLKFGIKFNTMQRIRACKSAIELYKKTNGERSLIYWYKFMRRVQKG